LKRKTFWNGGVCPFMSVVVRNGIILGIVYVS
jgi:hypothetical protein